MPTNKFLKYYLPPIIWAGVIFGLSSVPGSPLPPLPYIDKVAHLIEYGILGYLIARVFFRLNPKVKVKRLILFSLLIGGIYGMSDEVHQLFVPLRSFDLIDWLADLIGVTLGVMPLVAVRIFRKPKLLLHLCCASCGVYVIDLLKKKFRLTAYFYNPNVQPRGEYSQRLKDVRVLYGKLKIPLIVGDYEIRRWQKLTQGYENEPEGGKRCEICFQMRLERAVKLAKQKGFDYIATTLTVGPQKNAKLINTIGRQLGQKYGIMFYEADFKKQGGFQKSVELSKAWNFYRQSYCGCLYSKNKII